MQDFIKIHEKDNVIVALRTLAAGTEINLCDGAAGNGRASGTDPVAATDRAAENAPIAASDRWKCRHKNHCPHRDSRRAQDGNL